MKFENLDLTEPILKAIRDKGYETPTPIQTQSIPPLLNRRDILGIAQTGTGKTAAFAIPILQILQKQKHKFGKQNRKIKALIVTPTRELAIQIDESFKDYGKYLQHLKHTVIFGGVKQFHQVKVLKRGVDILIATPGRLLDLMNQGIVNLKDIKIFTLDEADRMLDMGFLPDIKRLIAKLPEKKQSLFFSATMPPEIASLTKKLLHDPVRVEVAPTSSTAEKIEQKIYNVDKNNKSKLLIHVLKNPEIKSALVFTRTKYGADKVARIVNKAGIKAEAIHGNKNQNARQRALKSFKNKNARILVATDIAARGIDINELSHVINYEIPNVPEDYVHRIGRTGRAGAEGIALSFCSWDEKGHIRKVERLIKKDIPVESEHPFPARSAPKVTAGASRGSRGPRGRGGRNGRRKSIPPTHGRKRRQYGRKRR